MGVHKLSWATIVLLLLPFIGILIVVLQRWIESMEEPVGEKSAHEGGHEEHGHGEAVAETGEGLAGSEAIHGVESAPAPEPEVKPGAETVTAEVQPVPEAITAEVQPVPEAITAEAMPTPEEAPTVDDLEIIEGIGPKIASVLREAGITSFARLAQTTPDELREILKTARVRLAAPESWPQQARLAAEGRWEELRAYQDQLKGGR